MKRIGMMIFLFTSVLILSGCDLIPEEIQDQLSAELCENDPGNELCQVDSLDDIEEQVVIAFVKDAVMKLDEGMCEDIISPTNPDLLKKCMNDPSSLLPGELDVGSLEDSGFSQEMSVYTILTEPDADGTKYEIKIEVVDIDGKMYIGTWDPGEYSPSSDQVDEIEIDQLLKSFFMALTDDTMSNEDFCAKYWEDGVDDDCNFVRNDFKDEYDEIVGFDVERSGPYTFNGHVTVLKNREQAEVRVEVFTVRQEFGPVQIKRVTFGEGPVDILGMAEEKLKMMLFDYFNPLYSDDVFFDIHTFTDESDMRQKDIYGVESFELYRLEQLDETSATATVRVRFKAGAELSKKVNIAFDDDSDGDSIPTFEFEATLPYNPMIEEDFIEKYFLDYFDEDVDDDGFFDMYDGAGMYNMYLKDRQSNVNSPNVTVTVTEGQYGAFKVEIKGLANQERPSFTLEVRVNRWEARMAIDTNGIDNDCDGVCEVITDPDTHMALFNLFLADYQNPEVSDQYIADMYFGKKINEVVESRKDFFNEGGTLRILEQVGPMDGEYIYILGGNESSRDTEPVKVVIKRIDKTSPLLMNISDPNDGDIPTQEQFADFIDSFVTATNTHSIAYTEMCSMFTPARRIDACSAMISRNVSQGYSLVSLLRLQQRPDLLIAEWEDSVGMTMTETFVFFTYFNEGKIYFELIPYIPDTKELIASQFEPYIMALNDPTISLQEACMYVDESSQDECTEIKQYLLDTMFMIKLDSVNMNDEDNYMIKLNVYNGDMMLGTLEYDTMYTMDNPLYQDRGNRGVNPLFEDNE